MSIPSWLRRSSRAHVLIATVVSVFVGPALVDILSDPRRPYGYVAPDAFYYFTVATNWVDFGSPSFDQVYATNGFHPLWQWIVTLLAGLLSACGVSRFALVPLSLLVGLALLAGAIVLFGLALTERGRLSPLFSLLPVGAWPLAISPVWWAARDLPGRERAPLFGTLWNFVNGLESALLVAIFAAVAWVYVKRPVVSVRGALGFGALLAALSLARLDHAVFALAIGGVPWVGHMLGRRWHEARLGLWTMAAWLAVLLLYLAYNRLTVGRFAPVSGAEKSTFPIPSLDTIRELAELHFRYPRKRMFWFGRLGSVTFPGLFALVYLPCVVRRQQEPAGTFLGLAKSHGRLTGFLALTALGALALSLYDVFFVRPWHVGEWYAPVSIVFMSLVALQAADAVARRVWQGWTSGGALFALALCGVTLVYFFEFHRLLPWGKAYASFCMDEAPRVVAHYAGAPPRLLSRDDGVVAFATGFPTTSGTRLTLDAEAAEAAQSGHFEELLAARGVDHLTSFHYGVMTGFRLHERSPRVQAFAESVLLAPPQRTYEVDYVDGTFGILRASD